MIDRFVVVETVSGRTKAELLRSLLQANGVQCELSQEALGWVHGLEIGSLGSVDLLVPSHQAKSARKVLKQYQKIK